MSIKNDKGKQLLSKTCSNTCLVCKKYFSTKSNLARHIKIFHKNDDEILDSVKKKALKYPCGSCNNSFSYLRNLNYHQRKIHGAPFMNKLKHTCALCKNTFGPKDIIEHLQKKHNIDIKYENHEFSTFEEYSKWKSDLEKNTRSKFVLYAEWVNRNNKKCNIFQCHRSGKYSSEGKGLRNIKKQGTNKINAYCPAAITVIKNEKGRYSVSFQTSHVGHQNDLVRLPLREEERKFIALKMASKVPLDNILDEIRNSIPNSRLERLHLLTRKDLQNIGRSLKSGKWTHDIEVSNDSSLKTVLRNEDETSNGSLFEGVGNEYDAFSESSLKVVGEENVSNQSPFEGIVRNEVEISHESSSRVAVGNEVEISHESPDIATVGNEVDRVIRQFTQEVLSFQERLGNIENEYLNIIHSVSSQEQLDILENNFKSLQANMNAINGEKTNEINFSVQSDYQDPVEETIISQKSISFKRQKEKLPEILFKKVRLEQNEDDMLSLIMNYKNKSRNASVKN